MKNITIIGAGVMGNIFLNALKKAKANFRVKIVGHDKDKLSLQNEDLIVIAVKPQSFAELRAELHGLIAKKTVVLSIMAGVNMEKIKKGLGVKKVARAMPNLGARVGKSMTVWTCSPVLSAGEREQVKFILRLFGKEIFVKDESIINKATAVSGSGPGFFFYFVECWLKAIVSLGFDKKTAEEILLATIDGANDILQKDKNASDLTAQVASKGGTTEAGLKALKKGNLTALLKKTLRQAAKRASEL
ncbi:MAG: pyrroline-5-carboxylate reductase dimerization domain-containing protein [Candidatus Falkowbacteria bacterium]